MTSSGRRWGGLLLLAVLLGASPAQSQTGGTAGDDAQRVTVVPGIRIQPRYTYDNADANNDFFIARTRIKLAGDAYAIGKYGVELKLDNVGRFARDVSAQIENAWMDFPLKPAFNLSVGLYDAVFSRNALTSDSKLLVMDRSLIKDALTALGLADNSVGLLGHGRPLDGHVDYSVGVFDNLQFEGSGSSTAKQADGTMQMARVGYQFHDPLPQAGYADYRSSYIGKGRRLDIAVNAAQLSKAREGGAEYDIWAWGGDVFFCRGPITMEAEYDRFKEETDAVGPGGANLNVDGEGWFAQTGYLVLAHDELAVRYQVLDANQGTFADRVRWTTVGWNHYLRDHNLKVQAEYTFKREQARGVQNDLLQVQLQLDY